MSNLVKVVAMTLQLYEFKSHAIDPNEKIFYDHGDLENKVKVKLMTCNKRCCHRASWVQISQSLPQMMTDLWTFDHPIGYNGKIQLSPVKLKNDYAMTLFCVCLAKFT